MRPAELCRGPNAPTWLYFNVGGTDMKQINQYQFYQLGVNLHPLGAMESGISLRKVAWDLLNAKMWLSYLLSESSPVQLVVSKESADELLTSLRQILPDVAGGSYTLPPIADNRTLNWQEAYSLKNGLEQFETVFAAELPTCVTYSVSKKGIYDTTDLTDRAHMAIDEDARKVLMSVSKEAILDFKQAGRCLAFELPTAAGFHTMRAVEAVLRIYWSLVLKPQLGTKPPEMAQCIDQLRKAGEEPKVMDVLDHARELHRNTIMHPEAFLSTKDALRLFDISKSALAAMADRINELQHPVPVPKPLNSLAVGTLAAAKS